MVSVDNWIFAFFIVSIFTAILVSISCAVYQTCLFAMAAMFPRESEMVTAVILGQGVGGIIGSIVDILTLGKSEAVQK